MGKERYILVTGGAGYIGSHTCKALAQAGYTPVVYDNLRYGHRHAVKWGPLVLGELADEARVEAVLQRYRPEAVLHFAAYLFVGESVEDPAKYYKNNVEGTLALLNAMRKCGVGNLVFSSTAAVYGMPDEVPIREDNPKAPINPYGRTKLATEWALEDYSNAYGFNYAALRYFNACGADPDGEIGEEHEPETHLIPRALMSVDGAINDFAVFGTDYDTPDGTCIRDYIHVSDLARGHILALDHLLEGGESGSFNLGAGVGYSVKEILDAVEAVTRRKVPVQFGPRRAGDPPVLTASIDAARAQLGFEPQCSDLESIVSSAWHFYQSLKREALAS